MHLPLLASQILTKESGDEVTILLPVLSYWRDQTPFSWPLRVDLHLKVCESQIFKVVSCEAVENSFSVVGLMARASIELSWAKLENGRNFMYEKKLTSQFLHRENLREAQVSFIQVERGLSIGELGLVGLGLGCGEVRLHISLKICDNFKLYKNIGC